VTRVSGSFPVQSTAVPYTVDPMLTGFWKPAVTFSIAGVPRSSVLKESNFSARAGPMRKTTRLRRSKPRSLALMKAIWRPTTVVPTTRMSDRAN
jgi:hypothetical protein